MNTIASFCKQLKQGYYPKKTNYAEPVKYWSEPDRYQDKIIKAFVIILKTKGCSWSEQSGCTMCGYFNASAHEQISDEDLISQFQQAMTGYQDEPVVKIFTSGSFFDTEEISTSVRNHIFQELIEKTTKIAVESRPEYITEKTLASIKPFFQKTKLEVGIGLESSDDIIREKNINKGFSFLDYEQAATLLKKYNHHLKTYVLVKPPFLTEKEAINDCIKTIESVKELTDQISLNPTNVQKNTLVEYLWKRKQYRPPWLWSVVEILQQGNKITSKRLQCDIAGGGSIRGAHNCKKCDKHVLRAIDTFSRSQNPYDLKDLDCTCKQHWKDQLELEPLSFGSIIDLKPEEIA